MGESVPSHEFDDEQSDSLSLGKIFRNGETYTTIDYRSLTEVDHLVRFMDEDETCPDEALRAVEVNLLTAVKEAAMPYAVSTTFQEHLDGDFMWLDQTPRQVAESGYRFHKHPNALKRVDIEVDEADDVRNNLERGRIKVFISPKMSRADAPYKAAKDEHLADDDMIRIHMPDFDEQGELRGKFMQSLLVRDIPLEAWVRMLEDPGNIFNKSFEITDKQSALSVMKLHHELELPESALPEGTISLVEAVLPYLSEEDRRAVEGQLLLFRDDQEAIHQKAEHIATRWLGFEFELAKSLKRQRATPEVESFVFSLQHEWGEEALGLLDSHTLSDGGLAMTRELAAMIEKAKQNTLWAVAAVVTHNERVTSQMDQQVVQRIYDTEMLIQQTMYEGGGYLDIIALEIQNNQAVARQNVKVGGGCAGDSDADFGSSKDDSPSSPSSSEERSANTADASDSAKEEKKNWKWKKGVCRVEVCSTRPGTTDVGPCSVCHKCQRVFDRGGDPTKNSPSKPEKPVLDLGRNAIAEVSFESQEAEADSKKPLKIGELVLAA